jgi:hypothetical protein
VTFEARAASSFSTGEGKGSGEGCGAGCCAHAGQRNAMAPNAIKNFRLFMFNSPSSFLGLSPFRER